MQAITFPNGPVSMAGNLYRPADFSPESPESSYAAIVTVHPGGGVKEQTEGLYASKMAERGFVALAYDTSHPSRWRSHLRSGVRAERESSASEG
ncbi:MAG: alpha/beta hydrolase [Actinobacteria bacterium]|nr:alpha/beta hydrolase [Actinomycetota bacterium]